MGARSKGREAALQMLFALDVGRGSDDAAETAGVAEGDLEQLIGDYWREVPGDPEGRPFSDELVRAVASRIDDFDGLIRAASKHWRLERMARVDRNVLRIGVAELSGGDDVPRAVIIDEAVELAKRYGAQGSSVFVNGVLDRIADELGR